MNTDTTLSPFWFVVNHGILWLVFMGLWLIMAQGLPSTFISFPETYQKYLTSILPLRLFVGSLVFIAIVLFYYFYMYYRSYSEKIIKEQELLHSIKQAELQALKSQLNPHFLFNSLHSISSLTITKPMLAQEMVINLSQYLRFTLLNQSKEWITLKEEWDQLGLYLAIEKVRFREKLQLEWIKDEQWDNVSIPTMLLQPLVENAIKHGVYDSLEASKVKIEVKKETNYLVIRIENEAHEGQTSMGTGTGIPNVKERLWVYYGKKDLLKTEKQGHIFTATVYLPM